MDASAAWRGVARDTPDGNCTRGGRARDELPGPDEAATGRDACRAAADAAPGVAGWHDRGDGDAPDHRPAQRLRALRLGDDGLPADLDDRGADLRQALRH